MTTNLINGKIYIGKCSKKTKNKYLGSGKLINRAIKKYGRENFSRKILDDDIENKNLLNEREKYWIKFYDATNLNIGYNISKGGDGNSEGNKNRTDDTNKKLSVSLKKYYETHSASLEGKHHSEETKKKISESNKGKIVSNETRERSSASMEGKLAGEKHWNWGKHHSDETKMKISESLRHGNPPKEVRKSLPMDQRRK